MTGRNTFPCIIGGIYDSFLFLVIIPVKIVVCRPLLYQPFFQGNLLPGYLLE
jgi:hypothetical protein